MSNSINMRRTLTTNIKFSKDNISLLSSPFAAARFILMTANAHTRTHTYGEIWFADCVRNWEKKTTQKP